MSELKDPVLDLNGTPLPLRSAQVQTFKGSLGLGREASEAIERVGRHHTACSSGSGDLVRRKLSPFVLCDVEESDFSEGGLVVASNRDQEELRLPEAEWKSELGARHGRKRNYLGFLGKLIS